MRPQKVLFISIGLTAFVLAMLAGVITAVKGASGSGASVAVTPATTTPIALDARQAADVASQYLNRTDMYSVETASISGTLGYKVVFSSGDVVYIGQDGQVLATEKIQPTVVVRTIQQPAQITAPQAVPVSSSVAQSQDDDDHDDHEEDDEDEDHDED